MEGLVLAGTLCFVVCLVQSVNIGFLYKDSRHNVSNVISYLDSTGALIPKDITIRETQLPAGELTQVISTVCDEVGNNTVAFVVVVPCSLLIAIAATVAHLVIPVLGVTTDRCPQQLTSTIRVLTPVTSGHDAILAILQKGGFSQTAIVTDRSDEEISYFRSRLSAHYYESSVSYLSGDANARAVTSWLSKVTGSDAAITCIILMLGNDNLSSLSHQLRSPETKLEDYIAIVVSDADVDSSLDLEGLSGFYDVLWLREAMFHVDSSTGDTHLQLVDVQSGESFRILFEAVTSSKMTSHTSTTMVTRHCGDREVNISSTSSLLINRLNEMITNTTAFNDTGISGQHDILRVNFENQSWSSERTATWSVKNGLEELDDAQLFRESTKGLGNITLKVGTTESPPFTMKLPNGTGWAGFCVDILDELASRLHFRYELIQSPDKMWGTVDEDGNWNGVVEMVRKKDVDLGIGPISLTSEREQVIDFTKPYSEEGAGIVLKRFEDKSSKIFRMFKPFSESVWLTISATVVVVGFTLAIVNHLSPNQNKEMDDSDRTERIKTSDNIWVVYESYMEQGAEKSPPNISGRFILGFWWIFTILMVASYKANLVAFLTVSFMDRPIKNIQDLADQTDIIPLVKQGSNLYQELKKGESVTFRKLWSMMQSAPSVTTIEEALELVLTGGYAFLTDQSQIEDMRTKDCENLMSGETPFNVGGLGFIVPESSPLLEMISFNLIQLQEAGLTRKWRQRWWPPSEMCPSQTKASNVQSLELESTGGPFLVFAGSTTIAIICLAVECVWWKSRKCSRRKSQEADDTSS